MRICLYVVAAIALLATSADARPRPQRGKRFEANKTVGVGLMLGEPSGLTGKYFMSPETAVDAAIGAYDYYRGRSGFDIHADYLIHPVSLASTDDFELPLYFGVGGRLLDFNQNDDHSFAFGVRVPAGISLDFNNIPLDVFFELAFVFDVFVDYPDDVGVDFNGALGVRYWFD
jgi:hypothetical protein